MTDVGGANPGLVFLGTIRKQTEDNIATIHMPREVKSRRVLGGMHGSPLERAIELILQVGWGWVGIK